MLYLRSIKLKLILGENMNDINAPLGGKRPARPDRQEPRPVDSSTVNSNRLNQPSSVTKEGDKKHLNPKATVARAPRVNKKPSNKKGKKFWILIALVGVILAVAIGFLVKFVYFQVSSPAQVDSIKLWKYTKSVEDKVQPSTKFAVGDTIMMRFDYSNAQPMAESKFVVKKGEEVVNTVNMPYLRSSETAPKEGKRYVSVVNNSNRKLDAGSYRLDIVSNGDRVIGGIDFTIE